MKHKKNRYFRVPNKIRTQFLGLITNFKKIILNHHAGQYMLLNDIYKISSRVGFRYRTRCGFDVIKYFFRQYFLGVTKVSLIALLNVIGHPSCSNIHSAGRSIFGRSETCHGAKNRSHLTDTLFTAIRS